MDSNACALRYVEDETTYYWPRAKAVRHIECPVSIHRQAPRAVRLMTLGKKLTSGLGARLLPCCRDNGNGETRS